MHNIQRVIQEGERMKKEIFEKSSRIEQQNEKISDLLERNRKFVEDSNTMLEQRNDSFKATTAQAQSRVLELEQEKSQRVEELVAATNKLATLQMEFTALQRAESEVRAQLALARDEAARATEELASLQAAAGGSTAKMEELARAHKEEKQLRKDAAQRLETLEDELAEAQTGFESTTKKSEALKKKAAEEKARLEDELEELKTQHENELEQMKRKLRKERQSGDADASSRIENMESELTASWTDKLQRAVANNDQRWELKYKNLEEDYNDLEARHATAQQTLQTTKSKDAERELMVQVEALQRTEADLRSQVVNLKADLDSTAAGVASVMKDASGAPSVSSESIEVAYSRGLTDGSKKAKNGHSTETVKALMNGMYKSLRIKFVEGEKYPTDNVMKEVLAVIKTSTLELLKSDEGKEDDSDSDDGGDDDDDDDDDDSDGDDSNSDEDDDKDAASGDDDDKDSDDDDDEAEKVADEIPDAAEAAPAADDAEVDTLDVGHGTAEEPKMDMEGKDNSASSSNESWIEVSPEAGVPEAEGGSKDAEPAKKDEDDDDSWDEGDNAGPPAPTATETSTGPGDDDDDDDDDSESEADTPAASTEPTAATAKA